MRFLDLPTPALLVDVPAMERNIRRMADFFAGLPCKLRPHFKAHKTPEIAIRQLAAGSCTGLTCATVGEAEVASTFCDDILVANEIVDAARCARLAELARRVRVTVAVDSLVAQHLIKTVAATRLMGAECIISGIRPEIAQTVVHLGIDLSNIVTKATLASALQYAFAMLKLDVKKIQNKATI